MDNNMYDYVDLDKTLDYHLYVFGKYYELNLAMEECAELIQSINKCYRYPNDENGIDNRENLIEEIVDVEIMIEQLRRIFNICDVDELKFLEQKNKKIFDYAKEKENATKKVKE